MTKEILFASIKNKYKQLKESLKGNDINLIRENALELHAMVHAAEISGRIEKTLADYVFDYMMEGNQNQLVSRQAYDVDLHYAGTKIVPICWHFWHAYRIEDLVSNILISNQNQIFNHTWKKMIGSPITDTGNALEFDEVIAFGKLINIEELRHYMISVGKNTRQILNSLTLE